MLVVRPSVRSSIRPSDLWTRYLKNRLTNQLQIWFTMSYHLKANAIDFGPCVKTKMAAIVLFNMYAIDTPCERDIFRTA